MKKTLLLFLSLAIILTIGIFTVKAVDYTTTGSFNFNNFNLNSYVQNEVYKYKCDATAGTCSKVKVASINTSDYFDTESECKTKCKKTSASSYSYTDTGFNSLNFNSLSNNTDNKPAGSGNNYGTANTGGTASGLSGFNWTVSSAPTTTKAQYNVTQGTAISGLNFNNSVSGNNQTVQNNATGLNNSTNFTTGSSLFGTGVTFKDQATPQAQQGTGNFFTNLLSGLGFGGDKAIPNSTVELPGDGTTDDNPTPPEPEEVDGTISFTYSPSKTYANGETIKVKVTKKPTAGKNDSFAFWYDLKVDWKNTPNNTDDDVVRGSNAITKDEFEIKTDGYYRIELTLKASTTGPSPKYAYKEYESKTVVLTLDEKKSEVSDTIQNDCSLDIVKFEPSTKGIIKVDTENPKDVNVTFELKCTSFEKSKFDVRPTKVSAYIDIPALHTQDKEVVECQTTGITRKNSTEYGLYTKGTQYTITCSKNIFANLPKDARNKFLMVDMYYKTNKKDGFHNGEEYEARFISMQDRVTVTTDGKEPPKQDEGSERTITLNAVLNPSSKDPRTFETSKGGKVNVTWTSKGYDACNLSSDTLVYIDGTGNIDKAGKEGKTEFNVGQNTKSEPIHHKINLTCSYLKDPATPVKETKTIQINVPAKEGASETETPTDPEKEKSWGEKCQSSKCSSTYALGSQIALKMNNGKVLNASNFKFAVKIGGDACDLNVFQKTFARLKIDGKIIQDVTISHNTKEREFNFGNIWEQLSDTTKKNIEETLKKYDGAPVNFYMEAWSTFDEEKAKTNKNVNCNWKSEVFKVTFVKQGETSGGAQEKNKTIACKEKCQSDLKNLPEQDMVDAYGGNSKQEAYENCVAKCEGKSIPFPKNTIQAGKPTGCSIVNSNNLKVNKNTLPSFAVQLKNINREYTGIVKVNAYMTIDDKDIYLPDWRFSGSAGVQDLIYPFNLNTTGSLKELGAIDFTKAKSAKMVVSVWANNKTYNSMDLCNRHEFNLEIDKTPPKDFDMLNGKKAANFCSANNPKFVYTSYDNGDLCVSVDYMGCNRENVLNAKIKFNGSEFQKLDIHGYPKQLKCVKKEGKTLVKKASTILCFNESCTKNCEYSNDGTKTSFVQCNNP